MPYYNCGIINDVEKHVFRVGATEYIICGGWVAPKPLFYFGYIKSITLLIAPSML